MRRAKWAGSVILALLLIGATIALAQVQEKGISGSAALKYKVVKLPPNIIEADYNTDGKPRRPPVRPVFPLDELSAEGWELISVTACEGGEFVCFLRKRR
jgi:hypothetical protein